MRNEIERERKMAHHLFYVSMKYTKTSDVILSLIERWEKMIGKCIEMLLKKTKRIKEIPIAPKARELAVRKIYKNKIITEVMDLYSLFRKIPKLKKIKEHEFRKRVAVRITDSGKEIVIDTDKLKEWHELLDDFLVQIKHKKKVKKVW